MAAAWQTLLLILFSLATSGSSNHQILQISQSSDLVIEVGKILCQAHLKVVYVYFENQTSLEYPGQILHRMSSCGISYISLRNHFRHGPLEAIKDDGVLMYMVMIMNDNSQPLALSLIRKKSAAKHLSHVFVLVRNSETVTAAWLRASFRQFWQIWLLNIVIIYWRNERLNIYRYNPFTDDFLIEVPYDSNELPTLAQLFPKTIPNMHGKPLRMCIYPDEVRAISGPQGQTFGTDGFMSSYIADRMNATRLVNRVPQYEQRNVSADICFHEIADESDDVAMNTRFLVPETFARRVESTVAHNRDDLCVIVPKAKTAPTFWNIFRSLGRLVWLSIILSLLLAHLFCCLAYGQHELGFRLQLFAGLLGQPLPLALPRRFSLQLFLICWLYFGMLICTAFRGNLTSMLVSQRSLPEIDNIHDLAASSYPIIIRPRHIKHIKRFLNSGGGPEEKVRQLMLPLNDKLMQQHFEDNDVSYAYLEKYHIASFQVHARRHTQLGRPLYHLMDNCLVPFLAVYIVPYGSPYLGFLNKLIRSWHEFGFERYWDRIMNTAFLKSGATVMHRRQPDDDPVVLQLEHYHAVFCLWALGTAIGSIVFLCEQLAHKWAKERSKG